MGTKMRLPTNTRGQRKLHAFIHIVCKSIAGHPDGYLGTGKNVTTSHCHTRSAQFIQSRGAHHMNDYMVLVGNPGMYEIMHSLIASHNETAILSDTGGGSFIDGVYRAAFALNATTPLDYEIYCAYRIRDLIELSKHLDEFDARYPALQPIEFHGKDIPKLGLARVNMK